MAAKAKRVRNPKRAAKTGDKEALARLDKMNANVKVIFFKRLRAENARDKLYEKHCADHDEEIKNLMNGLAVDTGGEKIDINNWYRIFAREQDALDMEEDDRKRVQDTNRIMVGAMKSESMLDFFDVLDGGVFIPPVLTDQTAAQAANDAQEATEAGEQEPAE